MQSERTLQWQGMNWIRQEKRLAIYIRDAFACVYCGQCADDGVKLSLDHVVPVSSGGDNSASNLITACMSCNASRGDQNIFSFVSSLKCPAYSLDHIFIMLSKPLNMAVAKAMLKARRSV